MGHGRWWGEVFWQGRNVSKGTRLAWENQGVPVDEQEMRFAVKNEVDLCALTWKEGQQLPITGNKSEDASEGEMPLHVCAYT